jgi:polysaccharide pyruvyl transferase WcaK-like protein
LDIIIEKFNCYILFLPHSIENIPYKNDILAAQRIASKMRANTDNYCVLEEDLSPMMLKGIIQHSDFLIAERTHSMISAISVGTPFVGFTTHIDKRTHDIVGNMCNLECNLFNMEYPDIKYTNNKIENMISNISEEKKLAKQTKEMIQKRIYESYIKKNIYYESIITNT